MGFVKYDLGHLSGGETAVVTIDHAANVMLLNSNNLNYYRNGSRFTYYGGHYDRSPVRIGVPNADTWHIVIDLGGRSGNIRSSCNVIG
jgi:hypothetical protein